ncbi:MAG: POTRA domain-containing protein, partial [Pseudomonadota bacterium]|nr:POTRA domain-containing protein [Pseudomonadota bacterium]
MQRAGGVGRGATPRRTGPCAAVPGSPLAPDRPGRDAGRADPTAGESPAQAESAEVSPGTPGFAAIPGLFAAGALLLAPVPAFAQGLPGGLPSALSNAPAAIRAATDRSRAEAPGPLGPDSELRFTSQTPPANAREIRFVLRGVELSGGTLYPDAELAPLWSEALDAEIDLAEVFALAARIQNRYRDDGYLFTRVVVPAQRIDGGRVRFEIVEATLASVTIEAPGLPLGPMRALAERTVAPLQGLRNP